MSQIKFKTNLKKIQIKNLNKQQGWTPVANIKRGNKKIVKIREETPHLRQLITGIAAIL